MANLPGWPYWKVISITGQAGAGTDYQVELEIGDSAGGDFHLEGHCTNFPQDITITDDDGTTLLDHFVEDLTADPIVVQVEVKDDLGSNRDIRVYYGKSGETTASNGSTTFEFFEDAEDNDISDWTLESGCAVSVVSDQAKHGTYSIKQIDGTYLAEGYKDMGSITANKVLEFWWRLAQTNLPSWIQIEKTGSDYANCIVLEADSTGQMGYYDGSHHFWGNYNANQWYHIKLILKLGTPDSAFDFYVDDNLKYSDAGTRGTVADSFQYFALMQATSGVAGTHWVDTIFLRKYNSPEPAFSSAGAEQSPTGVSPTGVFYGPLVGPFGGPI